MSRCRDTAVQVSNGLDGCKTVEAIAAIDAMLDHLGSARVVIDSSGVVKDHHQYYAYGQNLSQSTATNQSYRYTGQEYDDEGGFGVYYYGARSYDPILGQFLSLDPGRSRYPGWGPYVYCVDNPLKFVDPNGEDAREFLRGLGGGAWASITGTASSVYNMATNPGAAVSDMARGVRALVTDPGAVVAAVCSDIKTTWNSGDEGKGQVVGNLIAEVGLSLLATKGLDKLATTSRASSLAADIARVARGETYTTYVGIDDMGAVRYVGSTGRWPSIRYAEHLRAFGTGRELLQYRAVGTNLSRRASLSLEQSLVDKYGLGKNGGQLLNKINALARNRVH